MAYTSAVQIAGRNRWYRGYVQLNSVTKVSDTVARVSMTVGLDAQYAALYGVRLCAYINNQQVAYRDVVINNYGSWARQSTIANVTLDVARKGSAWTCPVQVRCYGKVVNGYGSAGGDVWATVNATVPQRGYSVPNPPRSPALARVSDTQQKLTWAGDYTDMNGARPWTGVYVDRQTDDGSWTTIATLGWSVTNYTDSSTTANHKYAYRLRSYGPGGTSSAASCGTTYTTPAAPSSVKAVKTATNAVEVQVYDAAPWASGHDLQRSADGGGTWTTLGLTEYAGSGYRYFTDASAPAGTCLYRARAKRTSPDALCSGWVSSNSVTTICAPNAPAVSGLSSVYVSGSEPTVRWAPNHPDGTAQTAAQVELSGPSPETYSVSGARTSVIFENIADGPWKVRVRTKGLADEWGAWSSYVAFTVAQPPQAWFDAPAYDGALVDSAPVTVSFSSFDATGIAQSTLTLPGGGKQDVTGRGSIEVGDYQTLSNGGAYTVTLTVRAGSGLTATATRSFVCHWPEPATPAVTVETDGALACHVTAANGTSAYHVEESTLVGPMAWDDEDAEISMLGTIGEEEGAVTIGDAPRCAYFTVERVLDEGAATLAGGLLDSQQVIDRIPPLNTDFVYRVTGFTDSGTSSQAEVVANVFAHGMALNFGQDAGLAMVLDFNGSSSTSADRDAEVFHFADGSGEGLPVSYPTDQLDMSTSFSWLMRRDLHEVFQKVMREQWHGWWRGHTGERVYGSMTFSESVKAPRVWSGSGKVRHERFEEPANG